MAKVQCEPDPNPGTDRNKGEKLQPHRKIIAAVLAATVLVTTLQQGIRIANTYSKIDADFTGGGLAYHSTIYGNGGTVIIDDSIETISPIEKDDPVIAQVLGELAPDQAKIAEADDGTRVEYYILNKHISPENGVVVFTMGWGGNVQTETAQQELIYLIANLPGPKQVIVINSVNTIPTKEAAAEMMSEGSFLAFGTSVDAAMAELLEEYPSSEIEQWGHSEGARRAIAQALAYYLRTGEQIETIKVLDPVGSHEQSIGSLALRFLEEGVYSTKYDNSSYDLSISVAQTNDDLNRDGWGYLWFNAPNTMKKNGVMIDLGEAIAVGAAKKVIIVSPELSALTRPNDVDEMLSEIDIPNNTIVYHIILRNHTHGSVGSGEVVRVEVSLYDSEGMRK